jgi:carbon storage regulator
VPHPPPDAARDISTSGGTTTEVDVLVLTRARDEKIIIGDDVEVMVVDIRGDKVRLGITAPEGVSIHRAEIYKAIRAESLAAAAALPGTLGPDGTFYCPCGGRHRRGAVNGGDVYRCLRCGEFRKAVPSAACT